MSIPALIAAYGYYALFCGIFIEGEAVLLAAGFAARRGMLDLPMVIAIAFAGGVVGDHFGFLLGQLHANKLVARFPGLVPKMARAHALLDRYHMPLIVAMRFLYGFRIAGPFVIGSSNVSPLRFTLLEMTGALLWATLYGFLGYWSGAAMELLIADIKQFEIGILAAFILGGAALWIWQERRVDKP